MPSTRHATFEIFIAVRLTVNRGRLTAKNPPTVANFASVLRPKYTYYYYYYVRILVGRTRVLHTLPPGESRNDGGYDFKASDSPHRTSSCSGSERDRECTVFTTVCFFFRSDTFPRSDFGEISKRQRVRKTVLGLKRFSKSSIIFRVKKSKKFSKISR